ncbi:MAG TPA: TRAP transporter small permease [Dehalococcoidales bacterium]
MSLFKLLTTVFERLLVSIIAFQAALLILSVFFRYILNSPIVWSDEIVRYSLVWMTFAGAALATRDDKHILVDVIDTTLSEKGRKITNWFVDLVVIAFMAFLIYYGIRMTDYERGMFGETLTWISYAYVYISIPIGAAVTILFTVSKYFVKGTHGSSPVSGPSLI